MKTSIIPPPEQEPTVTLELSVDEYVALWGLLYAKGDGHTPLRDAIEREFMGAVKRMDVRSVIARATQAFADDNQRMGGVFHRVDRALKKARS